MKQRYLLGLDIGNTWLRVCLASFQGKILFFKKIAVQPSWDLDQSLHQLFRLIETVLSRCDAREEELKRVGISFGGLADYEREEQSFLTIFPS